MTPEELSLGACRPGASGLGGFRIGEKDFEAEVAVRPSTLLTVTVAVSSSALSTIMLVVPVPFISLLTPPETVLEAPLTVTVVESQPVPPDLK